MRQIQWIRPAASRMVWQLTEDTAMLAVPAETEELLKALAAKAGTSPVELLTHIVAEKAASDGLLPIPKPVLDADRVQRLNAIIRHYKSLPVLDPRPVEEITDDLYDGL